MTAVLSCLQDSKDTGVMVSKVSMFVNVGRRWAAGEAGWKYVVIRVNKKGHSAREGFSSI